VSVVESDPGGESAFGFTLRTGESIVLVAVAGALMVGVQAEDGASRTLFPTLEDPLETLEILSRWAEGAAAAERVHRRGRPPLC
jgi:hypothetical protein